MKPRVIWLDDDIKKEKLKATVILFRKKFDLIECETIDEFYAKSKAYEWDAAILDVLNSDERSGDVFKSIHYITKEFEGKKWFVFSGKDRITKGDNDVKDALEDGPYSRTYASQTIYVKSEHENDLIQDVTTAVENSRIWTIENEYERVLNIAKTRLKGHDCRTILLDILCSAGGVKTINSQLYYNQIRVILEWMFRASRAAGLLHDKCFDVRDHINLTDSSLFMSGLPTMHSGVICNKAHFPFLVSKNVKFILEVSGGASHTTEVDKEDNPNLTAYWETINTPYLLYSLAYMLCDVLIWFDQYVESNSDAEANKRYWRDLVFEGDLAQDTGGNYYVGDCLITYKIATRFRIGDTLCVTEYIMTDPDKGVLYPLTATRVKLK